VDHTICTSGTTRFFCVVPLENVCPPYTSDLCGRPNRNRAFWRTAVGAPAPAKTETTEAGSVAGRPWLDVENVAPPTMTVYSPSGRVAVIGCPVAAIKTEASIFEGTEVCDWPTSKGMTCVLRTRDRSTMTSANVR
jgi:hypothetical protein